MRDPIDELYVLPGSEFIPARDRLAAKLAAAGQRGPARDVKALRRPTVAAWVVNQLAHRSGAALRRLIESGDVLRRAQRRVVRGGDTDDLRAATTARQEALRELRKLAGPVLREAGASTHLDHVLATLEAAAFDPEAARVVAAGRLSRELPRPSGFGDATAPLTLLVSRRATPDAHCGARTARDARVTRQRRMRELTATAERLARDAARSATAAARAGRRAATLERAFREHQRRVDALRAELQAAEHRLHTIEARLAGVRADASRASAHADELRRGAAAARAEARSEDGPRKA